MNYLKQFVIQLSYYWALDRYQMDDVQGINLNLTIAIEDNF